MNFKQSRYFRALDNDLPSQVIQNYCKDTSEKPTTLARTVNLISKHVPVPPQAYLTEEFFKHAGRKAPHDFLSEWQKSLIEWK